ncbi:MurR/RpiR family transcriptional regulator [Mesobacterium sp. TK19101]|uniref:MurR/RpiR family transcriptional regulator n=1 Tax=Mesobacterium hydrothermale TaxID=3111907 RepID=A0ABU6HFB2_9RHOB|nr:MurR/RpiR family transcriptional regulator [Mesobacterium sp. TK19101]MEC3861168.1 MurR/RpiR family transcriptional regulator [Mesobacterium sp. TK19101]
MPPLPPLRDMIRERMPDLTDAERRLAAVLTEDSMVNGLQSITKLAEDAGVSTPTIIRMARKLGFDGFPTLQNAIREELAARIKQPLAKLDQWGAGGADDHIINRFAQAASANINRTLDRLDLGSFDQAADVLSNTDRHVHLLGGRITRSIADYFFNHLQIIRPHVSLLAQSPNIWPHHLLDMDATSVLVLFDIRRYEKELERLADLAAERKVEILLFTDQWGSPIEKRASVCFRTMVEAPSSWDSNLAILFLVEALIAEVQSRSSRDSITRIDSLERMLGQTRLFRSDTGGQD